jgi:phage terminase large subunit GpA-like protein
VSAAQRYAQAIRDALRPDPKVKISQWAQDNRFLPPDTPEPGKFRNERIPHMVDVQDTMSQGSGYREGWLKKGVQLAGSTVGENFIGSSICNAAGSILVVFPDLPAAQMWEAQRFEPMREATPELRKRIPDSNVKGAGSTKLRKKFPGGVMRLVTANRVSGLKSSTIRYIKLEEPDEYPRDIGALGQKQGSPIGLARNRVKNFGSKGRLFADGTPTIEDASAIDDGYKRGDQRKRFMLCPHCDHAQMFVWKQFRWTDNDHLTAQYECEACFEPFPEHVWKRGRNWMRPLGWTEQQCKEAGYAYWEATAKGEPGVASWHLPSYYAPLGWRPWTQLVADWLGIKGDPVKLKEFLNNEAAECYRDKVLSSTNADALQKRAENYPMWWAPQKALVFVAGVDTQDNRLAITIRGYGRGEESWGLYHGEIYGSPSLPETWAKLRLLLEAPIKHASGQTVRVDAAFVDQGGHHAEDVKAFCRDAQLRGKHWMASAGAKAYDAPKLGRPKTVDFTWQGRPVPGGAMLRHLGTQAIKNLIDGRLQLSGEGAGVFHFPLAFERDYYEQMRSEKREWRRDQAGRKALWWEKGSGRNEYWDCEVYAYGAYLYVMSGRHTEQFFRTREKLLAPVAQADMWDPNASTPATSDAAPAPDPEALEAVALATSSPADLEPAAASEGSSDPPLDRDDPEPARAAAAPRKRPAPRRRGGFARTW